MFDKGQEAMALAAYIAFPIHKTHRRIPMRKLVVLLSLAYLTSFSPALLAQAQDTVKPLSIEQRLFNDFAVQMRQHLHETAALLDKIRQSSDAKEREKLTKEYHQATQTTMKINDAMHALIGGKGGMMGGKKMGAKGGGMGCMMMKKKSASAEQDGDDTSSQEEADAATAESAADDDAGKSSEQEGHH